MTGEAGVEASGASRPASLLDDAARGQEPPAEPPNLTGVVILLSALAVVVAVTLLVAGFVLQGGFALIYGAMGFAVLSMVLLSAARWMASSPERPGREAPEPLPELGAGADWLAPEDEDDVWARAAADDGAEAEVDAEVDAEADAEADAEVEVEVEVVPVAATGLPVFPIADYDGLWVSQIVPLVAELDRDELAVVEARERGGRHRAAILDAITRARAADAAPAPVAAPVAVGEDGETEDGEDERWAPEPVAAARPADEGVDEHAEAADDQDGWFTDDRAPVDWTELEEDADGPVPAVEMAELAELEPQPAPEPVAVSEPEPVADLDESAPVAERHEPEPSSAVEVPEPEDQLEPEPAADPEPEDQLEPEPAADPEPEDQADPDDADDGWEGVEPDAWDWSAVRGEQPPTAEPEPEGDGSPMVRTFLGRRRSPVTVQRD